MPERYRDPYPEERALELISRVEALSADDDAWTWLDGDPEVAWGADPIESPSYHGRLRAILEEAGWERCYHRGRGELHYNVKLNGSRAYRGFQDAISELHPDAQSRVEAIAGDPYGLQDQELEWFWEELRDFVKYELKSSGKVWQCGRSGGYAQPDKHLLTDGVAMVRLAQYLERNRDYFNSREFGEYLAERAIEVDEEEQIQALASPRPERVEA